ncbi:DNA recombination and repair protein Rad51 [Tribonema minus]|uniref:DNA recombination and repair protein Rad51 n=1 Tax=Tribonema minus TaxID=303371 RepID=A0A835ZFZ6_9STRA|nr:DNA recombination and repair protein Rad51 [Tribonema minus]
MTLFCTVFSGRGELAERHQKFNKHLTCLKILAHEFNLAVVIVVTPDPSSSSASTAGMDAISYASTARVMLKERCGTQRTAQICDSPLMPETECKIRICAGGIADPE